MRRNRGFTILEALIYSVLSAALLGGVTMYVQSGLRIYRGGDSYRDLQKDALFTMQRLTKDITNSTAGEDGDRVVLPSTPGDLIIFASADDLSTKPDYGTWAHDAKSGDLLWRKWVYFQLNLDERTLIRHEQSMKSVPKTKLPMPPTPEGFSGSSQVIGHQLERMSLSWLEPGEALEVQLTASAPTTTGAKDGTRIELRTSVHIEN